MDKGKIVAEGSPRGLIEEHATKEVVELRFPVGEAPQEEAFDGLAKRIELLPDRTLLYTDNADATLADLSERSLEIESTVVRRSSLEDVFLRLTGRTLVD
jgi:lipooligosaccharide transport system ATP-binding protein